MIEHFSISQINLFKQDPLEWIFQYLVGIKTPPSESLLFGSCFALSVEALLTDQPYARLNKNGSPTPFRQDIFDLAQKWIAENQAILGGAPWEVEKRFRAYLDPALPIFEGAMDLVDAPRLVIRDFKTVTENHDRRPPKFWGLNEAGLQQDFQLGFYAYVLAAPRMLVSPPPSVVGVDVGHFQIVKMKRGGEIYGYRFAEVTTAISWEQIVDTVAKIVEIGQEMKGVEKTFRDPAKGLDYLISKYGAQKKRILYGAPSPFFDVAMGNETVAECRRRIAEETVAAHKTNWFAKKDDFC